MIVSKDTDQIYQIRLHYHDGRVETVKLKGQTPVEIPEGVRDLELLHDGNYQIGAGAEVYATCRIIKLGAKE